MNFLKRILPDSLVQLLRPAYHRTLSYLGSLWYRHPSKKIRVVAVTGTKGKSSVCEMINSILEHAGYKTALVSTIRFKLGDDSKPNKLKMTMPGRFFLQKFLRSAVSAQCDWVIIEMTSEGARQYRHLGIHLDALVFTNISPEHIESHGSFANYVAAKFSISEALTHSVKNPRVIVANADDEYGADFLALHVEHAVPFGKQQAEPAHTSDTGTEITFNGSTIFSPMPGEFTIYNMLAAASFAHTFGVETSAIRKGLEALRLIPGRVERIETSEPFEVVVDYAHTPDSLQKLYEAFKEKKKICVLGNTGGGRDTWKRPEMAAIAENYCERVILTDEDPYDEDPEKIVQEMAAGMQAEPTIIMDRRRAIRVALSLAHGGEGDVVLISGKGTDPYIMRADGAREEWSDAAVAREELALILKSVEQNND